MEDVLEALEKINSDYEGQCRAARKLAEDYFDGKRIVMDMLQDLNLT
jgi:hypothetical protein